MVYCFRRGWKNAGSLPKNWGSSSSFSTFSPSPMSTQAGFRVNTAFSPSQNYKSVGESFSKRQKSVPNMTTSRSNISLSSQLEMIEAALQEDDETDRANYTGGHSGFFDDYDDSDMELGSEFDMGDKAQVKNCTLLFRMFVSVFQVLPSHNQSYQGFPNKLKSRAVNREQEMISRVSSRFCFKIFWVLPDFLRRAVVRICHPCLLQKIVLWQMAFILYVSLSHLPVNLHPPEFLSLLKNPAGFCKWNLWLVPALLSSWNSIVQAWRILMW